MSPALFSILWPLQTIVRMSLSSNSCKPLEPDPLLLPCSCVVSFIDRLKNTRRRLTGVGLFCIFASPTLKCLVFGFSFSLFSCNLLPICSAFNDGPVLFSFNSPLTLSSRYFEHALDSCPM